MAIQAGLTQFVFVNHRGTFQPMAAAKELARVGPEVRIQKSEAPNGRRAREYI